MPALGGEVISARWPFPIGAIRSMMRVVRPPAFVSRLSFSCGIERRQVVEQDLVPRRLGRLEVDRLDPQQREVALALLGRPDLAADRVAGAQVEAPDLRRRDVDVVGARQVVLVRRAQEAVAVGQDLEHALGEDLAVASRSGPSGSRRSAPACACPPRSRPRAPRRAPSAPARSCCFSSLTLMRSPALSAAVVDLVLVGLVVTGSPCGARPRAGRAMPLPPRERRPGRAAPAARSPGHRIRRAVASSRRSFGWWVRGRALRSAIAGVRGDSRPRSAGREPRSRPAGASVRRRSRGIGPPGAG